MPSLYSKHRGFNAKSSNLQSRIKRVGLDILPIFFSTKAVKKVLKV